jgi:hypothetical protein
MKQKIYLTDVFTTNDPLRDQSVWGDIENARDEYDSLQDAVEDLTGLILEVYDQNDEVVELMFTEADAYDYLYPFWNQKKVGRVTFPDWFPLVGGKKSI